MITKLQIQGFKCFVDQTLELSPVTVLSGINGVGKSSFLQALLLTKLAQAPAKHVSLNGPFELQLGQALDVARGQEIRLIATNDAGLVCHAVLVAKSDDDLVLEVAESHGSLPELGHVAYLQAERLGPRDFLRLDSRPDDELDVGVRGEFVAHVLSQKERRHNVDPVRCHRDQELGTTLGKQVEAWLQELVVGIEVRTEVFPNLGAAQIRLRQGGVAGEWLRAQNVGFGLSYVLPILVTGLIAPPGSVMIVENPEAHLHPKANHGSRSFLRRLRPRAFKLS